MVATGDTGKLWVGYQEAAVLASWRLTRNETVLGAGTELTAVLAHRQDYWLEHNEKFDVSLQMGGHRWVWYNATITSLNKRTIELSLPGNPTALDN